MGQLSTHAMQGATCNYLACLLKRLHLFQLVVRAPAYDAALWMGIIVASHTSGIRQ